MHASLGLDLEIARTVPNKPKARQEKDEIKDESKYVIKVVRDEKEKGETGFPWPLVFACMLLVLVLVMVTCNLIVLLLLTKLIVIA